MGYINKLQTLQAALQDAIAASSDGQIDDALTRSLSQVSQILGSGSSAGVATYTEQLTAPGTTTPRSFSGYSQLFCSYAIANINTSVTVQLEGQATATSAWVNLDALEVDTTKSANGSYGFTWQGTAENVRFNFVSKSGGSPTIDVAMRFA